TSSGLTPFDGSLPVSFLIVSTTAGIRVDPPTNNTLSSSFADKPASDNALRTGTIVFSTSSAVSSSNLALVNDNSKCNGPASPAVINGNEICVCDTPDKSFFAFSAASFKRCVAILSCDKSIPFSLRNSCTIYSIFFSTSSAVSSSNLALVNDNSKCNGPASPAVINGNEICVCDTPDKSFFAFSAASFKRCVAILSCDKSIPFSLRNSCTIYSIIFSSKSSPPKRLSPAVEITSNVPSPISKIETSNVPPPRSYTKIV